MPKTKKPTHKPPLSRAEVNRRCDYAFRAAVSIMLLSLAESGRFSNDELQEFWTRANDRADSMARGYCTLEDVQQTLRDDYGVTVGGSLQ